MRSAALDAAHISDVGLSTARTARPPPPGRLRSPAPAGSWADHVTGLERAKRESLCIHTSLALAGHAASPDSSLFGERRPTWPHPRFRTGSARWRAPDALWAAHTVGSEHGGAANTVGSEIEAESSCAQMLARAIPMRLTAAKVALAAQIGRMPGTSESGLPGTSSVRCVAVQPRCQARDFTRFDRARETVRNQVSLADCAGPMRPGERAPKTYPSNEEGAASAAPSPSHPAPERRTRSQFQTMLNPFVVLNVSLVQKVAALR